MNRKQIIEQMAGIQNSNPTEKVEKLSLLLIDAAILGDTELIKSLITSGAEVDKPDDYGRTALMFAAGLGNTKTVGLLINKGAEVDHADNEGQTALIHAAWRGRTENVELLIDKGAEVDHTNRYGSTALMFAARLGNTKTVGLLINNGAKVDLAANDGDTALTFAVRAGDTKTAELLILGTKEDISKYYTSSHLAIKKFLSNDSPYLSNIKRLISIRMPALRKQFCMIMNIAGLECTDSRFADPLPELPPEIWQMDIFRSYFTSLFKIEDAKFHASDLGRIPAESFVINEGIAAEMKVWAKLEYGKNSVGFKIVHQKPMKAKYLS